MKKSHFVALILGTIGGVFFSLGMCMALIEEWGMKTQGIGCGLMGLLVILLTVLVWRRMEGKAPLKLRPKAIIATLVGLVGALVLGVGLCLCLVFSKMLVGIVVGLMGILLLFMLIPLTVGLT